MTTMKKITVQQLSSHELEYLIVYIRGTHLVTFNQELDRAFAIPETHGLSPQSHMPRCHPKISSDGG